MSLEVEEKISRMGWINKVGIKINIKVIFFAYLKFVGSVALSGFGGPGTVFTGKNWSKIADPAQVFRDVILFV